MEICPWPKEDSLYLKYHNEEWGKYNKDDKNHFEFLVLESAQAGLSWITILRKRENYRKLYYDFIPEIVSSFDGEKIEEILSNKGIIRNKKKIEASVNNARLFLDIQKEFGTFNDYLLSFTLGKRITNYIQKIENLPPNSIVSDRLSIDMKKRGFKFLGSTIMYSHLQAVGIVNDHLTSCFRFKEIKRMDEEKTFGIYGDNIVIFNKGIYYDKVEDLDKFIVFHKNSKSIVGRIEYVKDNSYKIIIKNIKGKVELKKEVEIIFKKYLEEKKE